MSAPIAPGVWNQAVREQLDRIIRSSAFARSARSRHFLTFVVEEHLSGRVPKESIVGVAIFSKPALWDTQADSHVRVSARRLRTLLERYYRNEGSGDPLQIHLDPGSYVPRISDRHSTAASPSATGKPCDGEVEPHNVSGPVVKSRQTRTSLRTTAVLAAAFSAFAVWAASWGLLAPAIALLVPAAAFVFLTYRQIPDSPLVRISTAFFSLVSMSYVLSASTLIEVMSTVIGIRRFPPSVLYCVVSGFKFIPLFPLVVGYWLLYSLRDPCDDAESTLLRTIYDILGPLFLVLAICSILWFSGDFQIWRANIPGRSTVALGYCSTYLLNVACWYAGRRLLNQKLQKHGRGLLALCWLAFLPLTATAYSVDHEYNTMNDHDLDKRHPEAYKITNPPALDEVVAGSSSDIGDDLLWELRNYDFRQAFLNGSFYKQPFDDAFQIKSRAVMFGFRPNRQSTVQNSSFIIIRIPQTLADRLQFQPAGGF